MARIPRWALPLLPTALARDQPPAPSSSPSVLSISSTRWASLQELWNFSEPNYSFIMSSAPKSCMLLELPREIRDQILGEVLFPSDKKPGRFDQDYLGLAVTDSRQIFPYKIPGVGLSTFDVAILRTCRKLQYEGEAVLYGTSSWNLMYQDWSDDIKLSYEVFEKFPRRIRHLIRRVERKCYSESYEASVSLFDWTAFMRFLACECPNLQVLKLWGPGDRNEGRYWVQSCKQDKEWVQAILEIKSLTYFDIPVINGGVIYNYPEFKDDFLPWLKSELLQRPQLPRSEELSVDRRSRSSTKAPFRFLDLSRELRDKIYEYTLLPPDRRIHPSIKPWYDREVQNTVPLFLTCKQVQHEAEKVLYSHSIITSPLPKYDTKLLELFGGHDEEIDVENREEEDEEQPNSPSRSMSPRTVALVRNLRIGPTNRYARLPLLRFAACHLQLAFLEIVISPEVAMEMNWEWQSRSSTNSTWAWSGGWQYSSLQSIARIPNVTAEVSDPERSIDPVCLQWFTSGLRKCYLDKRANEKRMPWLFEEKYVMDNGGTPED